MTETPLWLPPVTDPLTTHRVQSWHVDLLTATDATVGGLDGVDALTIEQKLGATISGGGTLDLTDVDQGIDWLSARVQPWWAVRAGDAVVEWPLGVYLCSAPVETWSADGRRTWRVELLDKLLVLDEDKIDGTYSLAAGTVVTDAVRAVIAASGQTGAAVTDSAETLTSGMVWPAGTSRLRICNDLLASINFFSLRCDGDGQYVAAPYQPPSERVPVWDFSPSEASIVTPAFTRDQDLAGIPNKVVLVTAGTDSTPSLVGVASNVDPSSPTSQPSRGRWVVHSEDNVEATSQAVVDALAARRLLDLSTAVATQEIEHAPVPLALNDVVTRTWPTGSALASVQGWSLTTGGGSLMRTTLREVAG